MCRRMQHCANVHTPSRVVCLPDRRVLSYSADDAYRRGEVEQLTGCGDPFGLVYSVIRICLIEPAC
jgi:hypothetical protein